MFNKIKKIGSGGFGVVDEVSDKNGASFARKTYALNQNFTVTAEIDKQLRKRFEREANLQSGLKHKNIVPILSKHLHEEPPFFIMPLAIASLESDIKQSKTLNGNFLNAINDIIAGLEEIHSVRIYHRDLKPANVLRYATKDGESYYAISDFGLIALKQTQVSMLTTVGMRLTSDFYTAPEITQDLSKASQQSDIFSLGCILHDFVGTESRVPCNEIRETGPFAAILLSCTRQDPQRRFKSVSAVREALLQVAMSGAVAETVDAKVLLELLESGKDLKLKNWEKLTEFIEDNFKTPDAILLLKALTVAHIETVLAKSQSVAKRLGLKYAEWIRTSSFDFDYCDALAIRLKTFIALEDVELQAECILAMLFMGTDHNRWYVERIFYALVGANLNEDLARRLAVEFRADDRRIERAISHMERSIVVSRKGIHPLLQEALPESDD